MQAFRRAVGDDRALPAIQDYAAWSLRNSALRPDGTLDPARAGAWLNRHDSALSALPDLKARFADARSASEAIGTATAARRAALDAQQMGVLGRVTGASSPEEVTRVIGNALSSATGAQQMRALAQAASRDRGAQDGLRKAVADYLRSRFVNNGEALRSDAFQTFLRQRRDVLGQVFKPDEMRSLDAIAADLRRSHTPYPMVGTKAPKPTWLRTLVAELGGAVAGMAMSIKNPLVGWLAGKFAAKVVQAVRMAGINRSDELVREAMLNPAFARELLQTASQHNEPSALLRALARVSGSATSPVMPTPQSLPRLAPTQPQRPSMPTERFGLFGGGARP